MRLKIRLSVVMSFQRKSAKEKALTSLLGLYILRSKGSGKPNYSPSSAAAGKKIMCLLRLDLPKLRDYISSLGITFMASGTSCPGLIWQSQGHLSQLKIITNYCRFCLKFLELNVLVMESAKNKILECLSSKICPKQAGLLL